MPKPKTAVAKEIDSVLGKVVDGGTRLRLAELSRREALDCTPDELIATSWEWPPEP
jgi:hypothetical protein